VRVVQFGTFDVENFGDLLFPLIARSRLAETGIEFEFASPLRRPAVWAGGVDTLSVADVLAASDGRRGALLGGGNILHAKPGVVDYDITTLEHLVAYPSLWLGAASLAAGTGGPLCWNAPGVPATLPPAAAELMRWVGSLTSVVTVRDRQSRQRLEDAGLSCPINVVPDPGLDVARLWGADELAEVRARALERIGLPSDGYVTVHLNSRYADKDPATLARHVDRVSAEFDVPAVLLALGPCHGDVELAEEVAGASGARCAVVHPRDIREPVALISGCELYLGSSLHGMITACAFGRRGAVVAREVAEGNTKFTGFLEQFDATDLVMSSWEEAAQRLGELAREPLERWSAIGSTGTLALDRHWERIAQVLSTDDAGSGTRVAVGIHPWLSHETRTPQWLRNPLLDALVGDLRDGYERRCAHDQSSLAATDRARREAKEAARRAAETRREAVRSRDNLRTALAAERARTSELRGALAAARKRRDQVQFELERTLPRRLRRQWRALLASIRGRASGT
jgi:polysaccharide pyruvyl transferase WcaK-like protein